MKMQSKLIFKHLGTVLITFDAVCNEISAMIKCLPKPNSLATLLATSSALIKTKPLWQISSGSDVIDNKYRSKPLHVYKMVCNDDSFICKMNYLFIYYYLSYLNSALDFESKITNIKSVEAIIKNVTKLGMRPVRHDPSII